MAFRIAEKFPRFKFSLKITLISVTLSSLMFWASSWQWSKYHLKTDLLASYASNSTTPPIAFAAERFLVSQSSEGLPDPDLIKQDRAAVAELRFRKVHLRGHFDLLHQVAVTNRKDKDGPGHVLLAPLVLDSNSRVVWISRGFIPFVDREPKSWGKYDEAGTVEFDGVVQEAIAPSLLGPSNPEVSSSEPPPRLWFFEEIAKLNRMLPYPAIESVFVQRLGSTALGRYPEESVQIQVPPSTHFGYTIEWALLGSLALVAGFLLQAFPFRNPYRARASYPVIPRTAGGIERPSSATNSGQVANGTRHER